MFYMLISIASFSMMSFLVKTGYHINPNLNQWDVVMSRAVISTIFMSIQVKLCNVNISNFDGVGTYLFLTSFIGIASYIFLILSLNYISAAISALIIYSNPIFVVFLAYIFLKEKVTKYDIISVILVIGGCYIVIAGGSTSGESNSLIKGYILAILGCITQGVSTLYLRKTTLKLKDSRVYNFYNFINMLLFSILILPFTD